MSNLQNNTTSLQTILEIINNLPEASNGVELPELSSPATESEIFLNKQTIDQNGNILTGTFTIDEELETQEDFLTQIENALVGKASGGNAVPKLQDKTVFPETSSQSVKADSGYDGLNQVTVMAMPITEQAKPSIEIDSTGLITAYTTQSEGYVIGGTKSSIKQLAFQSAKTITPTTTSQTAIKSGYYACGSVVVQGDSNLIAGNIKSGVSIFGVNGTYVGSGSGTGNTDIEDTFVTGTLSVYENSRIKNIGQGVFAYCSNLTNIDFPICKTIGKSAFYSCSRLISVSFPKVTNIGSNAFCYCLSLTSVSFPQCTYIGDFAFINCSNLTSVSFPVCTTIGRYAFEDCSSLTSVSFPKVTNIGSNAFDCCKSLTTVSFPACTTISNAAFINCLNLTTVNLPVCISIYSNAFTSCSSLTSVNFPQCTTIGSNAFYRCYSLTTASFPACTSIGNSAFAYCLSLTSVSFPKCTSIGSYAFEYCRGLTSVSFPKCTSIGSYAFVSCSKLSEIYLLASSICTLANSNVFSNAGITNTTGSIYVPTSLVTSYKAATNWTYFSNIIFGIEVEDGDNEDDGDNGGNSNIITFEINGIQYEAEEGMTWEEWCNSEYNISGFYCYNTYINTTIGTYVCLGNDYVHQSDIIIVNSIYAYDAGYVGGGGN